MTDYRTRLRELVAVAEGRMRTAHVRYDEGMSADRFTVLAVALLLRAEGAAVALSDLAVAIELSRRMRKAVPTLGLTLDRSRTDAIEKAVGTLVERLPDTPDPQARAVRLARGRTTQTAGHAFDTAMKSRPEITGYTRGLTATPCKICIALYNNGATWPPDQPMSRHPGCTCVPIPILKGN